MKSYEDRFLATSYKDDEPVSFGLASPGEDPTWDFSIPETLFARAQKLSGAYDLHLLPVIDPYTRTQLNVQQCHTLMDELSFIAEIINDELLRQYISQVLNLAKKCIGKSGRSELVIEGP